MLTTTTTASVVASAGAPPQAQAAPVSRSRALVPVRVSGTRPIMLAVHGLMCDPGFATALGRALPEDQPVFTFLPVGMDGSEVPLASVEAIAAHYVSLARATVEGRPFQIAGYCAGSLIAMEMAHQFTALGMTPQRLFILDFARLPQSLAAKQSVADYEARQMATVARHMETNPFLQKNMSGWPVTVLATIKAARTYQMRTYNGSTCIFSSRQMLPLVRSSRTGWQGLVPSDTPIVVSGETREDLLAAGMAKIGRVIGRQRSS